MKGFTLIELVIAVSISLLATGVIIVNYNSYNATQRLRQTALTFKNDLRFIQAKAANGEKPSECSSLTGWVMTVAADSYAYQASCARELTGSPTTIQLTGITVSSGPASVMFKVLARGTNLSEPLFVVFSGSDKFYTIKISPSGDISDLGISQ